LWNAVIFLFCGFRCEKPVVSAVEITWFSSWHGACTGLGLTGDRCCVAVGRVADNRKDGERVEGPHFMTMAITPRKRDGFILTPEERKPVDLHPFQEALSSADTVDIQCNGIRVGEMHVEQIISQSSKMFPVEYTRITLLVIKEVI